MPTNTGVQLEIIRSPMEDKKIVLVTGCAKGGIGYEYCKAFAEHGCHVVASDLPDRLSDIDDLLGSEEAIAIDVADDRSVALAVSQVISRHSRIDVLVNNAGIGSTGPLAELSLDAVRRALEINTLGQLRMVQAVVPHMAARRTGRIVNVGSVVGAVPTPWAGSYCASKAAVHAMSDALRVELRPFGVQVIKVLPGSIRSNLGRANAEKLASQDWTLYAKFKEAIAERARASQGAGATDARAFARYVSKKVLSPKPPRQIAFGHMTALFAVLGWSPVWARDLFFAKRFGLDKKF